MLQQDALILLYNVHIHRLHYTIIDVQQLLINTHYRHNMYTIHLTCMFNIHVLGGPMPPFGPPPLIKYTPAYAIAACRQLWAEGLEVWTTLHNMAITMIYIQSGYCNHYYVYQ